MTLSSDSLSEVCWWFSNIQSASKKIHQSSPEVVIYTDASKTGWGAQIEAVLTLVAYGLTQNQPGTLIA